MRSLFLFLILLFLPFYPIFSQTEKFSVEIGYAYLNTQAISPAEGAEGFLEYAPSALTAKLSLATKWSFLDLSVGGIKLIKYGDEEDCINGGGVYVGVSPKFKRKYFGITSDLGIGAFGIRQYKNVLLLDKSRSITSYGGAGLGAYMALGVYFKYKQLSINPSVCCFFNGGDISYMMTGINIPLVYHF
ncbi:MAG: hypothetical protein ACRC9Q_04100 [Bacteroidales bacterium]